jgi:hypothetical protein
MPQINECFLQSTQHMTWSEHPQNTLSPCFIDKAKPVKPIQSGGEVTIQSRSNEKPTNEMETSHQLEVKQ